MPAAWIETPGAIVRLQSERLEVELPGIESEGSPASQPVSIPLAELDKLVVSERVRLTFAALCEVLRREVPVLIHDWQGKVLGSVIPPASSHAALRLRQYQLAQDSGFQTQITRRLVQAKIRNQRRLLSRLHATRPRDIGSVFDRLSAALHDTDRGAGVSVLRGIEGSAAAVYWPAWAAFLPPEFPFERRSTRPPHNPVNAVLSYLSSIVYGECLAACHRRGLDPGMGILHPPANYRWSLPLDLMEPFRAPVIEATAIRLFSHRMLAAADFEPHDTGIWLAPSGRRVVAEQFDRRVQRTFLSEHTGQQTTLRKQIEETTLSYRMALEDITAFRPFIMN